MASVKAQIFEPQETNMMQMLLCHSKSKGILKEKTEILLDMQGEKYRALREVRIKMASTITEEKSKVFTTPMEKPPPES